LFVFIDIINVVIFLYSGGNRLYIIRYFWGIAILYAFILRDLINVSILLEVVGLDMKLIVLTVVTLIFFTGCNASEQDQSHSSSSEEISALLNTISVDNEAILRQIERSRMSDHGYRMANVARSEACPYTTFLIKQARMYAGLDTDFEHRAMADIFLNRLENTNSLDLLDIYFTMLLVGDYYYMMSSNARQNLEDFFETLYCDIAGAYSFFPVDGFNGDRMDIEYLRPTYMVKKIKSTLGMEMRAICCWIDRITDELVYHAYVHNPDLDAFSSKFYDLIKLYQLRGLEAPKEKFFLAIQNFENNLDNIEELSDRIVLPIYFVDYLQFSLIMGHNSSNYNELIISELTNDDGFNEEVLFFPLDPLSFNYSIRSLYFAGYDFSEDLNLNELFRQFDNFLWDEISYIQPFETMSDFIETYFVDKIINILGLPMNESIDEFYQSISMGITYAMPQGIYMYLIALQQNDILYTINDIEVELINTLLLNLETFINLDWPAAIRLHQILPTIQSLELIGVEWSQKKSQLQNLLIILDSERLNSEESEDLFLDFLSLIMEIRLMNILQLNQSDLNELFEQVSKKLIDMKQAGSYDMILSQYMLLEVFHEAGYPIPDEIIELVIDVLHNSKHPSGLFTSGISAYEIIPTFMSTYYALSALDILYQAINQV